MFRILRIRPQPFALRFHAQVDFDTEIKMLVEVFFICHIQSLAVRQNLQSRQTIRMKDIVGGWV